MDPRIATCVWILSVDPFIVIFMIEKIESLKDLKAAFQTIIVKDYGDFKRKAVLYIHRYMEVGIPAEQKKSLSQLIHQIQYQPNFDIEKTRALSLQKLRDLEK